MGFSNQPSFKQLLKIPHRYATDILSRYKQDRPLRMLVDPDMTPLSWLTLLQEKQLWREIILFLCYGLPAKEAIWWGYRCVSDTAQANQAKTEHDALASVVNWIKRPTEENRRLAEVLSKRAELDNACGWLAQSVFWSGGSIAPVNLADSPPPLYLCSQAVSVAILLSAVSVGAEKRQQQFIRCISMGMDIANGGNGQDIYQ